MLEQLVIAIGQWYHVQVRCLTKVQRMAQGNIYICICAIIMPIESLSDKKSDLVIASPGFGELMMDYDAPTGKGYDSEDEMSVKEWEEDVEKEGAEASQNAHKAVKSKTATDAPMPKRQKAAQVPQTTATAWSNKGK